MEGSGATQNGQPQPAPHQGSLIRVEQVSRLPHLNPPQKKTQEDIIQKLWDSIHSNQAGSEQSTKAYSQLAKISHGLMQGMRNHQNSLKRQQQAQQQAAQQNVQGASGAQGGNTVAPFANLPAAIQARVNAQRFIFPPTMIEGTKPAEDWLREAKGRLGQALQRNDAAVRKKREYQNLISERNNSGQPFSQAEMDQLSARIQQCTKAINESVSFMEKFKEQQAGFQRGQPQHRFTNQGPPGPGAPGDGSVNVAAHMPQGVIQGPPRPEAHTLQSALAAQERATTQTGATSPQTQNVANSTPTQQHPSNSNPSPFTGQQQQPQPSSAIGGPQPLSHEMALQASSQNHSQTPTQNHPQSASSAHAHPHASLQQPAHQQPAPINNFLNPTKKDDRAPISKNFTAQAPRPIPVPPSRPTLNGGPGVGMPGQMAQPAMQEFPGYVLEGDEDSPLLSKTKLNELVREVCGMGSEENLTPEVEEIFLSVVDEFIDDLLTSACRLAKLRSSANLELRDIQLVLERKYNIRVPGYSLDEVRTVKRTAPTAGWAHKMSAVQAGKLTAREVGAASSGGAASGSGANGAAAGAAAKEG